MFVTFLSLTSLLCPYSGLLSFAPQGNSDMKKKKSGILVANFELSWACLELYEGKVLEFYYGIFQDWKVLENGHWSWKVLEICLTPLKKYEVYERQ